MDRFDLIIRTQVEFEAMYKSATWFNAVSVCFIGDGGTLKFTRSDGMGLLIPVTVKNIQGLNNAVIEVVNLSQDDTALWYEALPTTNDYWIDGLVVEGAGSGASDDGYGFRNCNHLINCTGTGTAGYNRRGYGFRDCTHLTNCIGTGNNPSAESYGFNNCTHLTNCTGTGTTGAGQGYGFCDCNQLTNCIGTSAAGNPRAMGFGYGFYNCTHLTNCIGTGTGIGLNVYGFGYGFYNCTHLNNCTGTGTGDSAENGNGYGYSKCTQLTNCTGTGIITSIGESNKGYSFYDCSYMNGCKEGATPSTTGFLGGTNTKVDTLTVAPTATT